MAFSQSALDADLAALHADVPDSFLFTEEDEDEGTYACNRISPKREVLESRLRDKISDYQLTLGVRHVLFETKAPVEGEKLTYDGRIYRILMVDADPVYGVDLHLDLGSEYTSKTA
jgi:hypothetical protein